jgi:two-component system nitrate/nitrite response regulator NarL
MPAHRPADSLTRVVVVDPRPAFRAGLVEAIQQGADLEVAAVAGYGSSASEQIDRLAPDVAVIDLHVLGFDGLRVLEGIIQDESQTRVLILAGHRDGPMVYQAIEAGAAGCLLKDADADTIGNAIAAVARGNHVFAPELVDMIAEQIRGQRRGGGGTLSERERAILRLTADGLPAMRVATELAVSESTVKTHLTHIYAKLGVSCAAAAVYEAMRLNILS